MREPRIASANPLALVAVGLLVDVVLLASIDPVTAGTAVLLELLLVPLTGLPLPAILRRAAPIGVAALLALATVTLYGQVEAPVYWQLGLITVSAGSITLAVATALRLVAVALPAVVLFSRLDATRLADALAQRLHLPARFVLAGLAATRLVEVLGDDWRTLALARRARGVGDTGRLKRLAGQGFGLLVVALRRAGDLASAMEARALGAPGPRTWSRPSRFGRPDALAVACGLLVAGGAVAVGVLSGSWRVALL